LSGGYEVGLQLVGAFDGLGGPGHHPLVADFHARRLADPVLEHHGQR
jgi:hypothetical protein